MPMTGAQRQARWRTKHDAAARASAVDRLDDLTPDQIAELSARELDRLEKACHRIARLVQAARKGHVTKRR